MNIVDAIGAYLYYAKNHRPQENVQAIRVNHQQLSDIRRCISDRDPLSLRYQDGLFALFGTPLLVEGSPEHFSRIKGVLDAANAMLDSLDKTDLGLHTRRFAEERAKLGVSWTEVIEKHHCDAVGYGWDEIWMAYVCYLCGELRGHTPAKVEPKKASLWRDEALR